MAILDFPSSPTVGQIYNAPNGASYRWDGAAWVSASAGSGGGGLGTQALYTANATLTTANHDSLINANAADVQLTLPAFSTALSGQVFRITRVDAQAARQATIMPAGADTIDGVNAFITIAPNESVTLMACGTVANARNWVRVADPTWRTIQSSNTLTPGDGNKVLVSQAAGNALQWGARTSKARLAGGLVADTADSVTLSLNGGAYPFSSNPDNTANASWALKLQAGSTDNCVLQRAPATSGVPAFASLLTVDSAGNLSIGAQGVLKNPSVTSQAHLLQHTNANLYLSTNLNIATSGLDDNTQPSWLLNLGATGADQITMRRAPAGSTTLTTLLTVDSAGKVIVPGPPAAGADQASLVLGSRTMKGRIQALPGQDWFGMAFNRVFAGAWSEDDTTKAGWDWYFQNDNFAVERQAPANGAQTTLFVLDSGGNLTIAGATAVKASGTTWANPSDPRLKTDVEPYAKGVAEVCQLEPITYRLKANPEGLCYGFDAAAVQPVFPECVTETTAKLDPDDPEPTEGVLSLDIHPILIALVNAVKELTARVEALEAHA